MRGELLDCAHMVEVAVREHDRLGRHAGPEQRSGGVDDRVPRSRQPRIHQHPASVLALADEHDVDDFQPQQRDVLRHAKRAARPTLSDEAAGRKRDLLSHQKRSSFPRCRKVNWVAMVDGRALEVSGARVKLEAVGSTRSTQA